MLAGSYLLISTKHNTQLTSLTGMLFVLHVFGQMMLWERDLLGYSELLKLNLRIYIIHELVYEMELNLNDKPKVGQE